MPDKNASQGSNPTKTPNKKIEAAPSVNAHFKAATEHTEDHLDDMKALKELLAGVTEAEQIAEADEKLQALLQRFPSHQQTTLDDRKHLSRQQQLEIADRYNPQFADLGREIAGEVKRLRKIPGGDEFTQPVVKLFTPKSK